MCSFEGMSVEKLFYFHFIIFERYGQRYGLCQKKQENELGFVCCME
jgi:hypothetical protein